MIPKYENLCPSTTDLELPFDICFVKNGVPKLRPDYTTDYGNAICVNYYKCLSIDESLTTNILSFCSEGTSFFICFNTFSTQHLVSIHLRERRLSGTFKEVKVKNK